jgi:flavodoxin
MDKILVVVYSYTGTSRRLGHMLCSQLGWPSGKIVEIDERAGPTGTLRCLADSLLRRRPSIRYEGPDPRDFDAVVLITPIWAWRLAGPMRSFVAGQGDALKQVAVLSVMASEGGPNAVAEIGRMLGRAPVLAAAFKSREVDDGSCAERLEAFGRALQSIRIDGAPVRAAELSPYAA